MNIASKCIFPTSERSSRSEFIRVRLINFDQNHSINVRIVPILVGAISATKEQIYGELLAPFLLRPDTVFVISSDFCHWGTRFSFTRYYPTGLGGESIRLDRKKESQITKEYPIHRSISAMDHEGMGILGRLSADSSVHEEFVRYVDDTGNTICGRHPIGLLVAAVESLGEGRSGARLKWVRYEQSSRCETIEDSSVSYASAYIAL